MAKFKQPANFDLGFEEIEPFTSFTPANIITEAYPLLFRDVPKEVKEYAKELLAKDWTIHPVRQDRGRCYARAKVITIPEFAINRGVEFKTWYISHEIAHAYDKCIHNHGPEFMEWLKKICPENCIHFELGYKPRNAAAAGITRPFIL